MIRPQASTPSDYLDLPDEVAAGLSWGLGWMLVDFGDDVLIGHGGNNDEYRSFAGFMSANGDGLVLLTNGANGQEVIDAIILP